MNECNNMACFPLLSIWSFHLHSSLLHPLAFKHDTFNCFSYFFLFFCIHSSSSVHVALDVVTVVIVVSIVVVIVILIAVIIVVVIVILILLVVIAVVTFVWVIVVVLLLWFLLWLLLWLLLGCFCWCPSFFCSMLSFSGPSLKI